MKRKKIISNRKSRVRRERDPIPWKYCFLTIVCGLLLVSGFFLAARLHFSSIDFGIKNANLRREVDKLKTDKRRLILRREIALSGINKAALKIGFRRRTASNIELVSLRRPLVPSRQTVVSSDELKTIKAFTKSKTLVKQDPVGLQDLEKKIMKTVINKPRKEKSERRANKKGRRSDIDEQILIAKKR